MRWSDVGFQQFAVNAVADHAPLELPMPAIFEYAVPGIFQYLQVESELLGVHFGGVVAGQRLERHSRLWWQDRLTENTDSFRLAGRAAWQP